MSFLDKQGLLLPLCLKSLLIQNSQIMENASKLDLSGFMVVPITMSNVSSLGPFASFEEAEKVAQNMNSIPQDDPWCTFEVQEWEATLSVEFTCIGMRVEDNHGNVGYRDKTDDKGNRVSEYFDKVLDMVFHDMHSIYRGA